MKTKTTLCYPICSKCEYSIMSPTSVVGCKLQALNVTHSKCAAAYVAAILRGDVCKQCMNNVLWCPHSKEVCKRVKEKTFT